MLYEDLVMEVQKLREEHETLHEAVKSLAHGLSHLVTAFDVMVHGAKVGPVTAFESGESEVSNVNH